jgi:membrane protein
METKGIFQLLKQSFKDFSDDDCPRMAAALSYYTVFALPPLLILILMIVGAFVDPQEATQAIGSNLPGEASNQIGTIVKQANNPAAKSGLSAVLGVFTLLLGATGAFLQLQAALNRAWEVEPDPKAGGLKSFIFKRVLSLGMLLSIAFLILVSLVLSSALEALGGAADEVVGGGIGPVFLKVGIEVLSFAVITLLFAGIFKVLPDARVALKDVWVGALATSLLFTLGKFGLSLYLGRSNPGQAFGAAGSLALILVWIYYSSMIVLFGAEFTQAWAENRGSGMEPEKGARRMRDETGRDLLEDGSDESDEKDGKRAKSGKRAKGGGDGKVRRVMLEKESEGRAQMSPRQEEKLDKELADARRRAEATLHEHPASGDGDRKG